MRAAVYARMSTDKQSADSPADQIGRCREFDDAARAETLSPSGVERVRWKKKGPGRGR
jgi:DNA invertase Pin-like site-specific DNA recombinase